MKVNLKVTGIVAAFVIALGALGYVGATALAQGTTPTPTATSTPTPTATPTPTPTLNERVVANTTKIAANTGSISQIISRVAVLETQHTWTCTTIVEEYDDEMDQRSNRDYWTEADARRGAISSVKSYMDKADSNGHRTVYWTDTGVKAELAKCGR